MCLLGRTGCRGALPVPEHCAHSGMSPGVDPGCGRAEQTPPAPGSPKWPDGIPSPCPSLSRPGKLSPGVLALHGTPSHGEPGAAEAGVRVEPRV